MEALVCRNLGDPTTRPDNSSDSVFTLSRNHPIPQLKSPNDVRVRVIATSLNFLNYYQVFGTYQVKLPVPFIPGSDFSGIVDAVGPNVTNFKVGDRVSSVAIAGSFAQYVVIDESDLYMVPEGCDMVAAATVLIAYATSHIALIHRANIQAGQVLMILGAAGGVGVSAVEIGKLQGAIVIAVARGEEKARFLKSLGADLVIDISKENVTDTIKGFLKARKLRGVDILYDPVGGKLSKESMKLLKWGAQIVIIGFASGEIPVIPTNIALVKNWTVHGLDAGAYRMYNPKFLKDTMKEMMVWQAKGLIKVHVSHTFSLSEAHQAFAALRDRKAIGKVVVLLDDPKASRAKL